MSYPSEPQNPQYQQQPQPQWNHQGGQPTTYSQPTTYGQPGMDPGGQHPPKQKKPLFKRWWFWLLVGIVVIVVIAVIGGIAGGGDTGGDTAASSGDDSTAAEGSDQKAADEGKEEKKDEAETAYGVGDTVKADGWELTVTKVEDGVNSVGDDFLNTKPQGQFIKVAMTVKNTTSSPEYFFEDNIKLADKSGNSYSADSEAGIYANEDSLLLEEINPGNTATGVLVFDVPKDASPDRLTFEGGLFSTPIEVSLS